MRLQPTSVSKTFTFKSLAVLLLPLISVFLAFIITRGDEKIGYLVIVGLFGATVTVLAFIYPIFGFCLTIFIAFFFADIKRLTKTELPIGVYIDALCFLTFGGTIVKRYLDRRKLSENLNHPIFWAFFVIIVYSIIQIFNPNGGPMGSSLIILRRFIALQVMFYCALQLFENRDTIVMFFKFWLFFALTAALYGCYQEWIGYPKYEMDYIMASPLTEGLLSLDNGNYRKFSFLPDPTSFGIMMSGTALICMVFLLELQVGRSKKIILLFATAILLLAMGYSGTRTAYFAFVVGIALYIMMTFSRQRTIIFSVVVLVLFLALLFLPIYNNPTLNRIRSTFEFSNDASFNVRDVNRHRIQPYIYSHPIGGGLGTTGGAPEDLGVDGGFMHPLRGFQTDSGFLRMALEYGWIGLILQCLTFFIVLQQGVRAYYRNDNPEVKVLLLAAVICIFSYIISHYAQGAIGTLPGAYLFYFLTALIIRLKEPKNI